MANQPERSFSCNNDNSCYHIDNNCFHYTLDNILHINNETTHDYVQVSARANGVEFNGVGIADKGANICVILRHAIMGDHYDKLVTPCEKECGGISGPSKVVGYIDVDTLILGTNDKCTIEKIRFDVIDSKHGPLLTRAPSVNIYLHKVGIFRFYRLSLTVAKLL